MTGVTRRRLLQVAAGGPLWLAGRSAAAATPVDETGFKKIGGIDQWIAIQGQDTRNPVILYLHGGPGEAQSPFLKEFLPWQRDFTVANWDQRGAGKTFGRNGASTPDMTLDRMMDDICEVAQHVCRRLSQRKLILVAQSFGSLLGVHAIKKRPELFHAYVGTAQIVSLKESFLDLARYARQKAGESGDQATLDALDQAEKLSGLRRLGALRRASSKWAISEADKPYVAMLDGFRGQPPYPKGDVADWIEGGHFSGNTIGMRTPAIEMRALGLDMPIPFFIVQGRDDHITGAEPARAYAEDVRAPTKGFFSIEGGHYACFTNQEAFVGILRKNVRPLAL
jgi:pimeloyl-ACP methyl ester carboxylesterase